jgi:hypothetical protein
LIRNCQNYPVQSNPQKVLAFQCFLRNLSKKHSFLVDFSQNIDFRQFSYNSYDFVIFGLGVRPQGPFSKALEGSSKVPRRFLEGSSKVPRRFLAARTQYSQKARKLIKTALNIQESSVFYEMDCFS